MLRRFSPRNLFRGQRKVLADYTEASTSKADRWARRILIVVPLAAGVLIGVFGSLPARAALLTVVALMAGAMLSSFTHLAGQRQRLTEKGAVWEEADRFDRDAMDETATHLLAGAYGGGVTGLILALGSSFERVPLAQHIFDGAAAAGITYLFLVFLVAVPRLYGAYVHLNSVRAPMSGTSAESGTKRERLL